MGAHHGEGQGDGEDPPSGAEVQGTVASPPPTPGPGGRMGVSSAAEPSQLLAPFSVCYRIAVGIRFLMVKMMFIHHEG